MYFNHLSVNEGLSQNSVTAIVQDESGFIWIGTKDGLNRYDGNEVKVFRRNADDPYSLGCNFVSALYVDPTGCIWVGTDQGLYLYRPEFERFDPFDRITAKGLSIMGGVSCIRPDREGRVWIAESSGTLFCYDKEKDRLDGYSFTNGESPYPFSFQTVCYVGGRVWLGDFGAGLLSCSNDMHSVDLYRDPVSGIAVFDGDYVNDLLEGAGNTLYVASFGGVWELDLFSLRLKPILKTDRDGKPVQGRCLCLSSSGKLLIGTESGLYTYDPVRGQVSNMRSSYFDRFALSDNAIYSIFEDRDKGIWVGSWFGGVDYCETPDSPFRKYYPGVSEGSLKGNHVREFCKGPDGRIWVGTEDAGLNVFDPRTERFQYFSPSKDFTNVHGMCMVGDELWVGTYAKGLYVVDPVSLSIKRRYVKGENCETLADNSVFTISTSPEGEVYIGTFGGLQRYDRNTARFEDIPELRHKFCYVVRFDSHGDLWALTYDEGIYLRSARDGTWRHFLNVPGDSSSLPQNRLTGCFEDASGSMWITTQGGGFARFLADSGTFETFDMRMGLPNDVVYQIEEGDDGRLWLSTNQGLVSFHPETGDIRVWKVSDGLLCDQYNYRSSFKDSDGTLYFGGIEGFVRFHPSFVTDHSFEASAILTELRINDVVARVGAHASPLKKSIAYTDAVDLRYRQNSISLGLSTFGYQPATGQIRYRMEGVDPEWLPLQSATGIRYPQLSPGRYRFVVQASTPGLPDRELTSLSIRVRPPWYSSPWAWALYGVLAVLTLYGLLRFLRWREDMNYHERLREVERKAEKDLYESKLRFFTDVAHEIRTPMTLIRGPLDHILQTACFDGDTAEDLSLMKKNSDKLLSLINQLLDFRKIESARYELDFQPCELSSRIREICSEYAYMLEEKGMTFQLSLPETDLWADVNPEAFTTIVTNLLNNGIKYSERELNLSMQVEGEHLVLETRNDGALVPPEKREAIFQPFVRYAPGREDMIPGTGIGLVYARSLAEAHGGTLRMREDPDWNVFRLELPLHQECAVPDVSGDARTEPVLPSFQDSSTRRKTLLLVEDNLDMRAFEVRELSRLYRVLEAGDGRQALEVLDGEVVDLVVSDVMMPVMDGYRLCEAVKSDIRFSHIPIVLLTAKTDDKSKITGLEMGADAYVEKPFSMDYLKASIASLLLNRDNMRKAFSRSPLIPVSSAVSTDADKKFIDEIYRIIARNYANTEFRMDDMASELNMSRTQFYRKIQGALDMTPNDLLRLERLKHAAALLKAGSYRISEVCYMTGFSSPSYFSKCFLKQFGLTPTDFISDSSTKDGRD